MIGLIDAMRSLNESRCATWASVREVLVTIFSEATVLRPDERKVMLPILPLALGIRTELRIAIMINFYWLDGGKSNIMFAISKKNPQKVTKIRVRGAHSRYGGTGELLKSYSRDTSRELSTGGRANEVWESHGGAAHTLGGALALKRRARVARTERPRRGRSRGSKRVPHKPPLS